MFGHIAVQDSPPVMRNDKEAVQHTECKRRNCEEVHRRNHLTMIAQESDPSHCRFRIPRCLPHPAQHSSLRNVEAKHLQFAVNSWCTPRWVLGDNAVDEFAQVFADAFSSRTLPMPREPRPIKLEPFAMPANNGLRLNEDQRLLPSVPETPQYHPEQFLRGNKAGLRSFRFRTASCCRRARFFNRRSWRE